MSFLTGRMVANIKHTMDEEFSSVGFAPGVVRGARAFKYDRLGRLLGVSFDHIWIPGENVAVCRREEFERRNNVQYIFNPFIYGSDYEEQQAEKRRLDEMVEHKFLTLESRAIHKAAEEKRKELEERQAKDLLPNCSHGFYAYYEGSNDYEESNRVNGIIEGYGEVVIGTRGFRSTKARIVALQFGEEVPENIRLRIRRNYPAIPIFNTFDAMVSEYPPEDFGSAPTPDNDPDFWTRKA